ncbi:MAG: hypothetical protein LBU32_15660 [Clostridiales bacterium]|nr:hypothetical protein [Clostridiales bacterium]
MNEFRHIIGEGNYGIEEVVPELRKEDPGREAGRLADDELMLADMLVVALLRSADSWADFAKANAEWLARCGAR